MMISSLALGLVAPLAATAAEVDEEELATASNIREAWWQADNSSFSENAATKQFPPEAVCLVQPAACSFPEGDDPQGQLGSTGNTVIGTGGDAFSQGQDQAAEGEQQVQEGQAEGGAEGGAVPEDSLPVSIAFGVPNYHSAVEIELPSIPDGERIDEFIVYLTQSNPTYSNSSPALRQAVLAGLTCASENPDGTRCKDEEFEKVVTRSCDGTPPEEGEQSEPCPRDDTPLLVEMCPIADDPATGDVDESDWRDGSGQEEDSIPGANCLFGAQGEIVLDADGNETGLWAFDLTFAARQWYADEMPNNGVLLRPGAAENFAYGDPESTYSKQVTFLNEVKFAEPQSSPPPAPPAPFVPPPASGPTDTGSAGSSGSLDVFATPQGSGSVPVTTTTTVPGSQPTVTEQPETAPAPTGTTTVADPGLATAPIGTPLGQPENPWWLWLLLPAFLGGGYMMSQALAEEVALASVRSGGALTRLLARQAVTGGPELISR